MQEILGHQLATFELVLNNHNVTEYVAKLQKSINEIIKSEVHGELLSLKFDTCTKHHRSVIRVNVQFLKNPTMIKRTLFFV